MKLRISILMFFSFLVFYSCQQEENTLTDNTRSGDIDTRNDDFLAVINVHWGEDKSDPVQGALVFNMETNELISETDGEGNSYIEPIPGVYRVVDPNYGNQQAVIYFPEDFIYDEETGKKRKVIAWDINGNPIYE